MGTGNKVITGTVVLLAANAPVYNNPQYSAVSGCTVYVTVHGPCLD